MSTVVVPQTPIASQSDAWRKVVGTCHMVMGLRKDYLDSLRVVQAEIGFEHIRGHGIFHDWMGVLRRYDVAGHAGTRYVWTYLDQIVDAYLEVGIKPFLELGFMPEALASGPETVFWWKGNITPPADYAEWNALVAATLRHLIARYGRDEVLSWPVEVWNEPSLPEFWKDASKAEYFRLYEETAKTVKDVDAGFQVGGPATSPQADDWYVPFAEHTDATDTPVDFFSFHAYATGPAQHVPFGVYQTMHGAGSLLEQFARPRTILGGHRLASVPHHVTEFNTSYRPDNPVHDTAYNAAYLAPTLVGGGDLVDSFSYWTFSDMFEEQGVPAAIFHGGFGLLTHRQIKKPTYHLYAFMARLGTQVLARGDDHLVTRHDDGRITVLAWQPVGGTDDPTEPDTHTLRLSIPLTRPDGTTPATAYVHRRRVNNHDGNAFTAWQQLGRPASPTTRQLDRLYEAAEPTVTHHATDVAPGIGRIDLPLTLAHHEITLIEIDPVTDETPTWIDDTRILGRF
ncbi:Xylan 1,4-beta-xylosidase [Xylanimonas cellulosilytica DSM 15894]|uniref:Xylan 1,4-beta-xylosidase n=1 Tax=Xylanimonas cellulosilytica (strain DSM 15894 / JCM 12276 / CECT 5975 / KCTC 9989 / LMG 20990 / NBRC 107835 / XIL07) TaxID=446471 RepID=D1BXN6_XYLCX|nr:xylan 1,4-beta-xylosidase [Xylanimonas cellulosilytica]ACZ31677.1 Xylan 1,4-beta-xylosidase [Xylanimonas cellulosilytica DSM 15894]